MKGIVLAGGSGTRLFPATQAMSKQLLPVFDKPMIYYPLSTLMLAEISEILIITTEVDQPGFKRLLGDGSDFGINLTYAVQQHPNGLAEAFLIGEEFLDGSAACLVLGDNIFYGQGLSKKLIGAKNRATDHGVSTVFGYQVKDPERFGVVAIDENNRATSIVEKPVKAESNYAVTGVYFYGADVVDYAKKVEPSDRGELEITSINSAYLNDENLFVEILGRGFTWFDTGTHAALLDASSFVETMERLQGFKIACLEEIGFSQGWISRENLEKRAIFYRKNDYGLYLTTL